jgi:hypothetical protein
VWERLILCENDRLLAEVTATLDDSVPARYIHCVLFESALSSDGGRLLCFSAQPGSLVVGQKLDAHHQEGDS